MIKHNINASNLIRGQAVDTLRKELMGQFRFLRLLEILWSNLDMVRKVYE